MIQNYNDFIRELLKAGFAMASANREGIYTIIPWNWNDPQPTDTPVRWHSGDDDIDPWRWRMRVFDSRNDIAYGKFFFKKGGYITREWYPYFLAARRGGKTFEDAYKAGTISFLAKQIYDMISIHGKIPFHTLKKVANISTKERATFERTLTELQMKFYISMCGASQQLSRDGSGYGWTSMVFSTTESFFGEETFNLASQLSKEEAIEKITIQFKALNPDLSAQKIDKCIRGMP